MEGYNKSKYESLRSIVRGDLMSLGWRGLKSVCGYEELGRWFNDSISWKIGT